MNRIKNFSILFILIMFLIFIELMPVTCIFKSVTGISCPSCGMTRAFIAIIHFQFVEALFQNILSIPLFIFIVFFIINVLIDFIKNKFEFIPKLLIFFKNYVWFIVVLLVISFVFNNLK